ncbi:winged helix-turn-helix transcriptional regulator [Conexibacter woesei]|uniref:Transcriptional regulator, HxlR family n=1 Tax=Conexibacter woesei (strain DSM 14684 / CCUG 47730 / CIP 108061 / JCM 11494 / NBRC 100937 / ID131577) TaxID=469383 RepID=D3F687_CONWI|nr:helix-turn-helix domain-containing protein [Conexibacter woesei]ADB48760.1 transcriptional regulator, HxlR family [Conexibacter woesei DSM 14684]
MKPLDRDMFSITCPSSAMPIRVGDKWTAMVIRCLQDGPRRFSEIRVPLAHVTPKVLTQTLRAMERDGLLTRTVFPEVPPRVVYELTPLGRTLLAPIDAACAWAQAHLSEILDARAAYEQQRAEQPVPAAS